MEILGDPKKAHVFRLPGCRTRTHRIAGGVCPQKQASVRHHALGEGFPAVGRSSVISVISFATSFLLQNRENVLGAVEMIRYYLYRDDKHSEEGGKTNNVIFDTDN
ncbi:hypothetical protein [Halorhabdus amylolytica]|uniref:hypothetical protein n=1 Tax=Halorhabdus amylolytica TaxID=2559573 RepID=UPI0010AB1E05|nr:hypothetical protein [Halorhabdus amylolytica]